jgi:hypothetical protein
MGKVDLGSVEYPTRANDNEEFVLLNGVPRVFHVSYDNLRGVDITKDPLYPSLLRKFPNLELWGHADFTSMEELSGGGQRFIFALVLLNGCHACEVGGAAHIAFDFDRSGFYQGTKLLRLSTMKGR